VKKLSKWQGIALKALYDFESLILLNTQPRFYSAKEVCNFIENDKQLTLKGTSRIDGALRALQERALVDFELPLCKPQKSASMRQASGMSEQTCIYWMIVMGLIDFIALFGAVAVVVAAAWFAAEVFWWLIGEEDSDE
jgi:hypothetical protein